MSLYHKEIDELERCTLQVKMLEDEFLVSRPYLEQSLVEAQYRFVQKYRADIIAQLRREADTPDDTPE